MEATDGGEALVYNTVSFLQLNRGDKTSRVWLANFEVVNFLRRLAHDQHSTEIFQLAGRISSTMQMAVTSGAGNDPFAKVKVLIADMIERLMREGSEDATHKAYCDKESGETKQKIDELKYDVEKYTSKLDKARSDSATLKMYVNTLHNQVAEVIRSQSEADKLRLKENKVYVQAKADLEQGLAGLRLALKILREYYASSASLMQQAPQSPKMHSHSSSLVQQAPQSPKTRSHSSSLVQQAPQSPKTHSPSADAGEGIVVMLEATESDFGKSLAMAEMTEDAKVTAYQQLSMENILAKKLKEQDIEVKTKAAAGLDKMATELASDLDSTHTELDAVLEYSEKIRAMCEVTPETYEERSGRRQAEIEGLKEAMQILEGEAILLQGDGHKKRLRGVAISQYKAS